MSKIKTGIIGFGAMAERHHLDALLESGLFEPIGVCDITPARRAKAESLGLKATGELDEFLAWDTEFVVVATDSAHHHEAALKSAAAGKHLLVEKPIAPTLAEAEQMAAAARERDLMFTVYHNRHLDPDYRMVKQAVLDGLLGDLYAIENRTAGAAPAVGFGTSDFNPDWRISATGGGTLLDFGPHWTEQVLDLAPDRKVVQVFADVRHLKWGDADDHFRIEMVFDNGLRATVGKSDVAYRSNGFKWWILGSEATLVGPEQTDGGVGEVLICRPQELLRRKRAVPAESLHANIAAHLREGAPLIITPEHALRVMRVLDAARESARRGKSVDTDI